MRFEQGRAIADRLGLPNYDHRFGSNSLANLQGVRPELIEWAKLTITLCRFDGTVQHGGGLRTLAQALSNKARGTGIINSLHRKQADGYSWAIDLLAITPGLGVDWNNRKAFRAMYKAGDTAAAILSLPTRSGADWDVDGIHEESGEWDLPHREYPKAKHMPAAMALLEKRRAELGLSDKLDLECQCPACGTRFTLEAVA